VEPRGFVEWAAQFVDLAGESTQSARSAATATDDLLN
jgi:hypothetical protein